MRQPSRQRISPTSCRRAGVLIAAPCTPGSPLSIPRKDSFYWPRSSFTKPARKIPLEPRAKTITPHTRIEFDGNCYSVPPELACRPVSIRADRDEVRILHEGNLMAQHIRCYQRGQLIVLPNHRLAAIAVFQRSQSSVLEHAFDALGPEAHQFHFHLRMQPVKSGVHLRRLLNLARLYGTAELLAAISRAIELGTYDATYVENLLLTERRRRQLPTPTLPAPKRRELIDEIDLESADPSIYDRFRNNADEDSHGERDDNLQARLDRDLIELKLLEIAKSYRKVLDEAARKGELLFGGLGDLDRSGTDCP